MKTDKETINIHFNNHTEYKSFREFMLNKIKAQSLNPSPANTNWGVYDWSKDKGDSNDS
jgi:hypothetical protein